MEHSEVKNAKLQKYDFIGLKAAEFYVYVEPRLHIVSNNATL